MVALLTSSIRLLLPLLCCCLASATTIRGAAFKREKPICVIGAGASGLGTVLALNNKGYKNIVVLEKEAGPGGKANNWIDPVGNAVYLGPVLATIDYATVLQLAAKLNVALTNVSLLERLQLFNYDTATIVPHTAFPLNVTALKTAVARYAALWESHSHYVVPGYVNGIPPELAVPFSTWLTSNELEPLLPSMYLALTLFGYGSLTKLPTIIAITCVKPRSLEGILGFLPLFSLDYKLLFTRLASTLHAKFVYNASIVSMKRGSLGATIFYHINSAAAKKATKNKCSGGNNSRSMKDKQQHDAQKLVQCSRLVVAFPQRLDRLHAFDLDAKEVAVFKPVTTTQFFTTAVQFPSNLEPFVRADVLKLSGAASPPFIIAEPNGQGQPVLYTVRDQFAFTSRYGVAYSWKDTNSDGSNTFISLDKVKSLVVSSLSPLNRNASQSVAEAVVPIKASDIAMAKGYLDNFPHYNVTSVQKGMLEKLANLQGYRSTYYTSSLRSFDIVESVLESAADLVATYF